MEVNMDLTAADVRHQYDRRVYNQYNYKMGFLLTSLKLLFLVLSDSGDCRSISREQQMRREEIGVNFATNMEKTSDTQKSERKECRTWRMPAITQL